VAQLRVYVGAVVGCASDSIGGGCCGSVGEMLWLSWGDVVAQLGRCGGSVGEMWWLSWEDVVAQLRVYVGAVVGCAIVALLGGSGGPMEVM
jgi:hypothetical protein